MIDFIQAIRAHFSGTLKHFGFVEEKVVHNKENFDNAYVLYYNEKIQVYLRFVRDRSQHFILVGLPGQPESEWMDAERLSDLQFFPVIYVVHTRLKDIDWNSET